MTAATPGTSRTAASAAFPVPQHKGVYPRFPEHEEATTERPRNTVDHRPQNGPLLTYLWPTTNEDQEPSNSLSGQTLYLGMEVGCDGKLYGIPGHASRVLQLDPTTDRLQLIGPSFPGKFKWLRGVRCGDVIYGLPCHADSVLRIHVPSGEITTLEIPYRTAYCEDPELVHQQRHQKWKYHGGSISPRTKCVYAIPQSALHVLKIDPSTDAVSLIGPTLPGCYKWYGGVVGKHDGAIYGIPHNASHVLRICDDDRVSLHGDFGTGGHKWHGASAAPNGTIVAVPANADTVLCILPSPTGDPELVELGDSNCIQTGRHRHDNKYKYLGAITGTDGKVYCFPSGSERILQIDADSRTVQTVGPNLYDSRMERLCQNKWQNGVTLSHDRCVYGIPLAAESVLKIDCSTDPPLITTWPLPAPHQGLAKWEGAIVAPNGVIYTVPNNHKAVLRIEHPRSDGTPSISSAALSTAASSASHERVKEQQHYDLPYTSGIPTLRSSAHRVKYHLQSRKHDPKPHHSNGARSKDTWLPPELRTETVLDYPSDLFQDVCRAVRNILRQCDPTIVGEFRAGSERLEDFVVPVQSTWRQVNGGQCEKAQQYLSQRVSEDAAFLEVFDRMLAECVLPYLKARLVQLNLVNSEPQSATFYYQRPPTIRLQPGPAWAQVKAHNDAEYGHQNGELVSGLFR